MIAWVRSIVVMRRMLVAVPAVGKPAHAASVWVPDQPR